MDRRRQTSSFENYSNSQFGSMNSGERPLIDRRRMSSTSNYGGNPNVNYRDSRPEDDYYSWSQQYYGPISGLGSGPPPPAPIPPPAAFPYYPGVSSYYPYPAVQYPPQQQLYRDYEEPESVIPLDKDFRVFLAETKRNQRSSMTSFINISVMIQLLKYQFKITVDTSQSVDYLAKMVEADFNFQIEELEGKKVAPLLVRLVLNSQNHPINFNQIVGDVLSTNDSIIIIHSEKQMDDVKIDLTHSGMLLALDRFRETIDQDDLLLKKILKSKEGFRHFAEYCYREYSLEYLLFWLEVELFVESPPETWLLIARYIHKTYLRRNSPLRLNLRGDIIEDIPLPTYEIVQRDQTLFDETQQDAYNVMKLHLLRGFTQSSGYQQWTNKEKEIQSYFIDFTPDYNLMLELTKVDYIDVFELPENAATAQIDYCRNVRENVLERIALRYFVSFPFTGRYFQSISNTPLKMKLVTKERKLTKFFGEKPFFEDIQTQGRRASFSNSEFGIASTIDSEMRGSMMSRNSFMTKAEDIRQNKVKKLDKLEGFFGGRPPTFVEEQNPVQNVNNNSNRMSILNMLKPEVSKSTEIVEEEIQFHDKNELSEDEKRILKKRQKKLADVLGTKLDNDIMKSQKTVPETPVVNNDREKEIPKVKEVVNNPALEEFHDLANFYFDTDEPQTSPTAASFENGALTSGRKSIADIEVDDEKVDKDIRMKRIDKLYSILGERISPTVLEKSRLSVIAGRAKSATEKNIGRKRFDKLQKKFGESVPINSVYSNIDYSKRAEEHLSGIKTLERMMTNQGNLKTMITEIYENSPLSTPTKLVESTTSLDLDDDDEFNEQMKSSKQRKFQKLQKFFGDNLNATILFEQTILKDLEETIKEEYSGREEYQTLQSELDLLKEKARALNDTPPTAFYTSPEIVLRKESFNTAISKPKPSRLNSTLREKDLKTIVISENEALSHKSLNDLNSPRSSFRNAAQNSLQKLRKPPLLRTTQSMIDVKGEVLSAQEQPEFPTTGRPKNRNSTVIQEDQAQQLTLSRERIEANSNRQSKIESPKNESSINRQSRRSIDDDILADYMS